MYVCNFHLWHEWADHSNLWLCSIWIYMNDNIDSSWLLLLHNTTYKKLSVFFIVRALSAPLPIRRRSFCQCYCHKQNEVIFSLKSTRLNQEHYQIVSRLAERWRIDLAIIMISLLPYVWFLHFYFYMFPFVLSCIHFSNMWHFFMRTISTSVNHIIFPFPLAYWWCQIHV